MMKKITVLTLCAMLFVLCGPVEAQQAKKVPRIGYLSSSTSASASAFSEAFRQGLRDLGYVEKKTILVEYRYAEEVLDRLPVLAGELVVLKVDVIVAAGGSSLVEPARKATDTIPIVMTSSADPVGSGLVASLARPGGNVTGLSTLALELGDKRLELLKEVSSKTLPRRHTRGSGQPRLRSTDERGRGRTAGVGSAASATRDSCSQ
jgi:ABC-type uncharacterized transport system substrate-binding protein